MAQMAQTIFIFNDKKPRLYRIQYILARHLPVLQRSIKSVSGSARIHDRATKRAGFFFFIIIIVGPSERNETVKPAVTLETAVPNGLYYMVYSHSY